MLLAALLVALLAREQAMNNGLLESMGVISSNNGKALELLARALRLDTVQNLYSNGLIDLEPALELLNGPLNPLDPEQLIVDDSSHLIRLGKELPNE